MAQMKIGRGRIKTSFDDKGFASRKFLLELIFGDELRDAPPDEGKLFRARND